MYNSKEMFSQSVLPLLSLNPEASTLQDRLEILLNDINHVCGTSFKTERQVWSQDLMSVAMADKDGEDPSYFQLMRSGASPDARGAYAFVFFFLLLISVLLSIFLQPHCFSFSFLTRRIKW